MRPSVLINLFLSSICLLTFACSPLKNYKFAGLKKVDEKVIWPVLNKEYAQKFKTTLDAGNHHFSGILILKQTSADTAHLTFVTEIGMKMFDFTISNQKLDLAYVFEPMNKPELIKMLQEDLHLALLIDIMGFDAEHYTKGNEFIYRRQEIPKTYYFGANTMVTKILKKKNIGIKKKVIYTFGPDGTLDQISLKHKSIVTLKLNLKKLSPIEP